MTSIRVTFPQSVRLHNVELDDFLRSTEQRVRLYLVERTPHRWSFRTKSRSDRAGRDGDERYAVEYYPGRQTAYCTCKGFEYRGRCKHLAGLVKRLLRERAIEATSAYKRQLRRMRDVTYKVLRETKSEGH